MWTRCTSTNSLPILVTAAHSGNLVMVQWLVEVYLPSGRVRQTVEEAARWGRLDILRWLYEHHTKRVAWGYKELRVAMSYGRADVVEWLLQNPCSETPGKTELAPQIPIPLAETIKAMTWLAKWPTAECSRQWPSLMIAATESGELEKLQNLYDRNGCRVPSECLSHQTRTPRGCAVAPHNESLATCPFERDYRRAARQGTLWLVGDDQVDAGELAFCWWHRRQVLFEACGSGCS